jgi:hypothetical protein
MKVLARQPWLRQPGESAKAFEGFLAYAEFGVDRSITKAAQKIGKSPSLLARWSQRHKWTARTAAWDSDQAEVRRRKRLAHFMEMEDRHRQVAIAFQAKVIQRMNLIRPEELSPLELAKWFEIATKIERLAIGEVTERFAVEHSGGIETSNEIAQLVFEDPILERAILESIARRAGIPNRPVGPSGMPADSVHGS